VSEAHHGVRGAGYGHPFLKEGDLQQAHIYALVSYNNFRTNFSNAQADEFVVRYSFGSHAGDWRAGRPWRFGRNVANAPLPVWMEGQNVDGRLPMSSSFCEVDAPNVVVQALKQAEDGRGSIVRLWEVGGMDTTTTLRTPRLPWMHAFETDLVERDLRLLGGRQEGLIVTLEPYALKTFRLVPAEA
jgi:alpha-mannosidase